MLHNIFKTSFMSMFEDTYNSTLGGSGWEEQVGRSKASGIA